MPLASPQILQTRKKLKPLVPTKIKNKTLAQSNKQNPSTDETYGVSNQLITGT